MIYNLYSVVNSKNVGNKAHNLMLLKRSSFNIPNGFVIDVGYVSNIKKNGFLDKYKKEILFYLYDCIFTKPTFPVVVRSSGLLEDSKDSSFAGKYKSVINVNSEKELFLAIKEVIKSAKNDKLAIIIQKQVEMSISGVYFTKNPIGKSNFLIEYVFGHLHNLVSGKENSQKINKTKNLNSTFKKLYILGKNIEFIFKYPQDIEFAIDENKKIWILQSRSITTLNNLKNSKDINVNDVNKVNTKKYSSKIKGITLSNGFAKGEIQFISDAVNFKEANKLFKKGNILLTYVLFPEYINVYKKAKAVVCEVNSITSHPAIISRELGIPCIGGINISELLKYTTDNDEIIVDANNSLVYFKSFNKNNNFCNKKKTYKSINLYETKEFNIIKNKIIKLIKNKDFKNLEILLSNSIKVMQEYIKNYFNNNDNDNNNNNNNNKKNKLLLAKSYFYGLCNILQNDFINYFENTNKKELLKMITKVDQNNKAKNSLEKTYLIIKNYTQNMDDLGKVKGKCIWDLK
jgi:phosphoenolpyruvate synthase/pyruvate phosphate dikinase